MVCKARAGMWDSPCSIAYLIVGKAATIRYNVPKQNIISYAFLSIWHLHKARPQALAHGRVSDLVGLLVLRNVKVDPDEDLFALEGDVGDGELAREGHGG